MQNIVVCTNCGFWQGGKLEFGNNVVVSLGGNIHICVKCRKPFNPAPVMFETKDDKIEYLSASWLKQVKKDIEDEGLNANEAEKIRAEISAAKKAGDTGDLTTKIRDINSVVGEAVEQAIKKSKGKADAWDWLVRIGIVVGIVAGLNSMSAEYNVDALIDWAQSQGVEIVEPQADTAPDQKTDPDRQQDDDDFPG
ncbi:hypothetical protein [uncultured Roseobacter sp.]|uniref:hypothetical protein n=1 Tax=uncultured Roseobacter sp. TaxID=114847 RepID=UPI0026094E9F|nr:hypothetical protein [uncultured Roseobacter sp.]